MPKFNKDDLDRIISLYNLKDKSRRTVVPPVMHIYRVSIQGANSDFVVLLNQRRGKGYSEQVVSKLEDGVRLKKIKVLNVDSKNFILATKELDLLMRAGEQWCETIEDIRVHYHNVPIQRSNKWMIFKSGWATIVHLCIMCRRNFMDSLMMRYRFKLMH